MIFNSPNAQVKSPKIKELQAKQSALSQRVKSVRDLRTPFYLLHINSILILENLSYTCFTHATSADLDVPDEDDDDDPPPDLVYPNVMGEPPAFGGSAESESLTVKLMPWRQPLTIDKSNKPPK